MLDIYPDSTRIYVEGNIGWYISRYDNLLYQVDIDKKTCTFLTRLPESGTDASHANFMGCKYKDMLVCIPGISNYIRIYHLNERKFDSIKMPETEGVVSWSIYLHVMIDNFLYMFSPINKMIIVLDLEKLNIDKTINLNPNNDLDIISGVTRYKDSMLFYIGYGKETAIYEFDAKFETVSKCCMINKDDRYNTIAFDGDCFWLSGKKGELLKINKYLGEQKVIKFTDFLCDFKVYNFNISNNDIEDICLEKRNCSEILFAYSFILKGKVWFLPYRSSHIICVDLQSNEVIPIELENEIETVESIKARGSGLRQYKYIYEWIENDSNLVIYSMKNDCHYIIDGNTRKCVDTFKKYKIVNYNTLLEYYNNITKENMFYESNDWLEKDLYKYKLQSHNCDMTEEKFVTNGYNIYKCV